MAIIELEEAKLFLDVVISEDDEKLQSLLNGAIDEAVQFLGYDSAEDLEDYIASSSSIYPTMPESIKTAIKLLLQADYQTPANEIEILRKSAETKLTPFRIGWGV